MKDTYDMFREAERGRFGDGGRITGNASVRSDLVDLTLVLHHATDRAALLSVTGEEARAVRVPLVHIELVRTQKTVRGTRKNGQAVNLPLAEVTVPGWLARDKGLI